MRNTAVAMVLLSLASQCFAFQPCPNDAKPCASVSQLILYLVLPTLLLATAGVLMHRKLAARWLRISVLVALVFLWVFGILVVLAVFNAFLAPCANTCWYKP
jgi:hypothetical protein